MIILSILAKVFHSCNIILTLINLTLNILIHLTNSHTYLVISVTFDNLVVIIENRLGRKGGRRLRVVKEGRGARGVAFLRRKMQDSKAKFSFILKISYMH